jgi:hypothetical protein
MEIQILSATFSNQKAELKCKVTTNTISVSILDNLKKSSVIEMKLSDDINKYFKHVNTIFENSEIILVLKSFAYDVLPSELLFLLSGTTWLEIKQLDNFEDKELIQKLHKIESYI